MALGARAIERPLAEQAPRWFVSAPDEVDVRPLLTRLRQRGIRPYLLSDVARLGESLVRSLTDAIGEADGVLVVLAEGPTRSNALFEAGMAVALGKPVTVLAESGADLPVDLAGLFVVRAPLQDLDALEFALDSARGRDLGRSRSLDATEHPLGARADRFAEIATAILDTGPSVATEQGVLEILTQAIEASGAVVVRSSDADGRFDLGVWSDDLASIAANPLLVELTSTLTPWAASQTLTALQARPSAQAALIVSTEATGPDVAVVANSRYPVLVVSLFALLDGMRLASFAEVVRRLRNEAAHGPSQR